MMMPVVHTRSSFEDLPLVDRWVGCPPDGLGSGGAGANHIRTLLVFLHNMRYLAMAVLPVVRRPALLYDTVGAAMHRAHPPACVERALGGKGGADHKDKKKDSPANTCGTLFWDL